ncbi:type II secretion system protein [Kribbella catacumbae]|uniref:type II secretion system protein n=1 Tax=Kribbella catacumbae TaxID=460086 RepID=UPI00037D420E|nr:prepilin-type N-terminal cleavage/methylation domain-containing protein [Kribbella catacumbae]
MLHNLRQARRNESGFTLIELLIVIVILGILSGIVVFAVSGINDRGVSAACKSDVATIATAQEAMYAKSNPAAYAANVAGLKAAGLIRDVPASTHYTIETNSAGRVLVNGVVDAPCP